jgi:hypothetical protein
MKSLAIGLWSLAFGLWLEIDLIAKMPIEILPIELIG